MKKRRSKQPITDSTSHDPHPERQQATQSDDLLRPYHTQTPEEQYYQEVRRSRSPSRDNDSNTNAIRRANRVSRAFSPSERNKSQQLSEEQIEELFLELMNKGDLKSLPNSVAPEWYLKKFLDGTITDNHMSSLSVSLRTLPIKWVRSFIDTKGLEVLVNQLNSITRKTIKRESDLKMEYEIIKCLKSLLNNRWGAQEALSHPTCIYSITFSLVSSQLNTRKLVAEVLSFFCYCEIPIGHTLVLEGFDQLMQFQSEHGRFDAWMRVLENTIDGRGRYGSLVYASEEYKKIGIGIDNSLMKYALANMILVNSIIGVCEDVEVRVHLRNQLHASGLTRIIDKMKTFNYELITRQINEFEHESKLDYEDVMDYYNNQILKDMTDPHDVFQCILSTVKDTRAYDFFLSTIQHMLLIRSNDVEIRARYFQVIDSLVTQVVMDRHGINEDWNNSVGRTVSQVLAKFADQEKIQAALEEAKEAKAIAEKALHEKNALRRELASREDGTSGDKIETLEELLRISRHTIKTLQQKLVDLEASYLEKLTEHNVELRDIERILREQQKVSDSGSVNRQEIMIKLKRMQEIANTEAKLVEEEVWTPTSGEFKMPDAYEYIHNNNAATTGTIESQSTLADGFSPLKEPRMNPDLINELKNYKKKNDGQIGSQQDDLSNLFGDPESTKIQDGQDRPQSGLPPSSKVLPSSPINSSDISVAFSVPSQSSNILGDPELTKIQDEQDQPKPGLPPSSEVLPSSPINSIKIQDGQDRPQSGLPPSSEVLPSSPINSSDGSAAFGVSSQEPQSDKSNDGTPSSEQGATSSPLPSSKKPSPSDVSTSPPTNSGLPLSPPGDNGSSSPPPSSNGPPSLPPSNDGPPSLLPSNNGPPSLSGPPPLPGPPPPPPSFGLPSKKLPFAAKKKLLQLQWEKLNMLSIKKTFWGQANMSDEELLRLLGGESGVFASIEDLFSAKEIALRKKKTEKKKEISVLNSKRASDINVIIWRYKEITFEEIHKKIIEMDELFCTENLLCQLLHTTPTADERGKLAVFKEGTEDFENLARADRFFVEVMKIHRYEQRLKFMYFCVTFDEQFTDLNDNVLSILNASIALKESKNFKELLNLILLLGNYMNGSGLKGGAFGFKIGSINKLVDTKASNNSSITLLHFLADTVENKVPHIAGFIEELKDCGSACRVSQQDMVDEYRTMGTKLNDLAVELQKHYTDVEIEENDKFPVVMKEFVTKSQEKFEQLRIKYTSMEVAYKDVLSYYGEDPKNTKSDEFFGIFKTFVTSFERAKSDNKKIKESELAAKRRKEEMESRRKRAKNTGLRDGEGVAVDSSEEKHLMDNLLKTLKDGRNLDTSSRNRRVVRTMSIALKAESILNQLKEDAPPLPEAPRRIVVE